LVSWSGSIYCQFQWTGDGAPDYSLLRNPTRSVEQDCPVVGLAAATAPPALDPSLWTPLRNNFRDEVGRLSWTPPFQTTRVTVAVIDSAVRDYGDTADQDTYGHGRLMGRTIADLACPRAPLSAQSLFCNLTLRNALAVPRIPDNHNGYGIIDTTNGGYFGTRGELASALSSTLADWEASHMPGDRLILNLSLGWEQNLPPNLFADQADNAVMLLLQRASCLGALTIVAAGNQSGGTAPGGFLPAFWGSKDAPPPAFCAGFSPDLTQDPSTAVQRPLLYAVGAVDERDRPLLTARTASWPRLAADGMGAVFDDVRQPGNTLILSGSSVATAVVSGVAAAVWQSAIGLSGPDVMTAVYNSAVGLGASTLPTNICYQTCDPTRRVSLCNALMQIEARVGLPQVHCAVLPSGLGSSIQLPMPAVQPTPLVSSGGTPPAPPPPEQPWVWPQPPNPACPSCVFYGSAACATSAQASSHGVFGQLSTDLTSRVQSLLSQSGATLQSVQAVVNLDGRTTNVYTLGGSTYSLGSPPPFWLAAPSAVTQATLSITFDTGPPIGLVTSNAQAIPVICQP
jgi:hypothetical protein